MELGKQIKTKRSELNLSQDELADRIYVTRQTISNWENDKNYPDIHSLLLLSNVFHISLDELIKGDIEIMKDQIAKEDIIKFNKAMNIFSILLISSIISLAPLYFYFKTYGFIVWAILGIITFIYSLKVERYKKVNNIHTYKEIVAFMNGKRLDEITSHQEYGKRNYQTYILAVCFGIAAFTITLLVLKVLTQFG